ncbi:MAG TPA: long-chain fatty acid--CoA ligase [bacterium]|nr:long-chain fatty acid--CoA ligase [bacterium]
MSSQPAAAGVHFKSQTIPGMVREVAERFADRPAVTHKDKSGRYRTITYSELVALVDHVARALKLQGIKRGDKVAICSYHGPDWVVADLAIMTLGAIVVPIYHTLSATLVAHILRDSDSRLVFAENAKVFDTIQSVRETVPDLEQVAVFDDAGMEGRLRFLRFSSMKIESPASSCERVTEVISPETTATIIYTSGTTGDPKGVMLTHANLVSNALAGAERFHLTPSDVHLSFLPLCHVLERTGLYSALFAGAAIAYGGGVATVAEDMLAVRPTVLIVVPRIIEKIYEAVERSVMEGPALRRWMVLDAIRTLNRRVNLEYKGLKVPLFLRLRCSVHDRFVASKFRALAGGRLRFVISGGAPLDRNMAKTLLAVGFKILQGYGLTETSPGVTTTSLEDNRLGTVGKPYPGVEVTIGPNDEILVRGPNVMKGYYNRPEDTAAAIDPAGWFHTGDQGAFDQWGNLVITGRIKELIVTSYGKNIAPLRIEADLAQCSLIDQVMVCGDRRKYITALVVPRRDAITRYAQEAGIKSDTYADLLKHAGIRKLVADEIEKATQNAAPYERVKGFILLAEGFTVESDLMTPTLKLRRGKIERKYAAEIAALYSEA